MRFQIEVTTPLRLHLQHQSWLGKIAESIRIVLNTPAGSIPSNREFGIDMTYLHLPDNAAKSAFAGAAAEAIERFVPNIRVNQVVFEDGGPPGTLNPLIEVTYYE